MRQRQEPSSSPPAPQTQPPSPQSQPPQPPQSQTHYEEDPNFDRRLDEITHGASPYIRDHLVNRITRENCHTIISYIMAMQVEVNPSNQYRRDTIYKLKQLAEFHHPKSFREMTRQDIINYLDHMRKPESVDPLHKWIGSYEVYRITFLRFFKWLYNPDLSQDKRPKPAVMHDIPRLRRREISTYKPTDMWTEEDDLLFYKYCPFTRDRAWHAVSRDTGCRTHELLNLKIKDVIFLRLESGHQIAKITVNGKTGVRTVRLNNSIPFVKDWLSTGHPFGSNPSAPLFCGIGRRSLGRKLGEHAIQVMYRRYQKIVFPQLLHHDPTTTSEEDKQKIEALLKKTWNPYSRRHTAVTEKSQILKDPNLINQYFGWKPNSKTHIKYQHYYADEAVEALLVADGLVPSSGGNKSKKNILKTIQCPNCDESNKPGSKFCMSCKFALSFDAYNEVTNEAEQNKQELQKTKDKVEQLFNAYKNHLDRWDNFINVFTKSMSKEGKGSSEALLAAFNAINETK